MKDTREKLSALIFGIDGLHRYVSLAVVIWYCEVNITNSKPLTNVGGSFFDQIFGAISLNLHIIYRIM
ncbi:hypothetical protein JBW_02189 [Pelosinus fermentans JBW45]|uniref:Uncharacterized protein n=1 Tax=Pelosinus fermentans JBW45 TaxID=1192197 RepID=I9NQL0_9FIRM|nr:hypothetical protein JBW_02189 [Pelosinus fermentans JBW45]